MSLIRVTLCLLFVFCLASTTAQTDTQSSVQEVAIPESSFSPFTDLSAFSVGLGSFETNYSLSDLQVRLGPALYLGNPYHAEHLRLELGYDNQLTGFIADTGLFANLGYQIPFSNDIIAEVRAGLFPVDVENLSFSDMALGAKVLLQTQSVNINSVSGDGSSLTTTSEIGLLTYRNNSEIMIPAKTHISLDSARRDAFGFGLSGQKLEIYAGITPAFTDSYAGVYSHAYGDMQFYFTPENIGSFSVRLVVGNHPDMMGSYIPQSDLSGNLYLSYRNSILTNFSVIDGVGLERITLSPRVGVYVDEIIAGGADLGISLDIDLYETPTSIYGLVGYETGEGLIIGAGLNLGY